MITKNKRIVRHIIYRLLIITMIFLGLNWHAVAKDGPSPSDIHVSIKESDQSFQLGKNLRLLIMASNVTDRAHTLHETGNTWNKTKIFLFDLKGIPLGKAPAILKSEWKGEPFWDAFNLGSIRFGDINPQSKWSWEIVIDEQININSPGAYRAICIRRLTFWENDFAVTDIYTLNINVSTNDAGDFAYELPENGKMKEAWGSPFRGIELSVSPVSVPFELMDDINLKIFARNTGTNDVEIKSTSSSKRDFRVMLFLEDGRYFIPKVSQTEGAPKLWPVEVNFAEGKSLAPGEKTLYNVPLREWYDIEEPGTYYVLVARRIESWDIGFPVSNLAKIEIVDQDEEEPASINNSSGH